jgi:hypothetical protein
MQTPYDMLRKDPDGNFIWLEAATDLAVRRARLRYLAAKAPGDYVLFDRAKQQTIENISSHAVTTR